MICEEEFMRRYCRRIPCGRGWGRASLKEVFIMSGMPEWPGDAKRNTASRLPRAPKATQFACCAVCVPRRRDEYDGNSVAFVVAAHAFVAAY